MFKKTDKVYFHRGPVELVGEVESVSPGSVTLLGVELGFRSPARSRITIAEAEFLCRMDDETFERLTKDEPAFSGRCDDPLAAAPPAGRQSLGAVG